MVENPLRIAYDIHSLSVGVVDAHKCSAVAYDSESDETK